MNPPPGSGYTARMKPRLAFAAAFPLFALLAACGNKGPLIKPSQAEKAQQEAAQRPPGSSGQDSAAPADDTSTLPATTPVDQGTSPPAQTQGTAPATPPADTDSDDDDDGAPSVTP